MPAETLLYFPDRVRDTPLGTYLTYTEAKYKPTSLNIHKLKENNIFFFAYRYVYGAADKDLKSLIVVT